MSAYLSYWKPAQVNWENPDAERLDHAASQQYHKVCAGDQVYLLSSRNGDMFLLGRIIVDTVVGQAEAAARLGRDADSLWKADYHLLAKTGTVTTLRLIRCEDALRKLDIISGDRAEPIKEPITGQRFQAMRQITPASAAVLDDLLRDNKLTHLEPN